MALIFRLEWIKNHAAWCLLGFKSDYNIQLSCKSSFLPMLQVCLFVLPYGKKDFEQSSVKVQSWLLAR